MAKWKLCFVLLLPLIVPCDSEETLVKTIGSKPDVTPICTNTTLEPIALIVCKIRTELSGGEECHLLYRYEVGFVHECDSRFTLMMENQTVFLHLTSLTPADSGSYTCECTYHGGTYMLHLNITVEGDEDSSSSEQMQVPVVLIAATLVFTIIAVIFGFIYRTIRHGRQPQPLSSQPNMEPEHLEPYSTFIQRENGLYSTVRMHNTNNSNMFSTKKL